MKSLPAELILEKNELASGSAWLILLEITLTDGTVLRLVNNTEDITFGGNAYTAINFELDANKEGLKGEIPSVQLKISNVTRLLQSYLESQDGSIGSDITMYIVNSDNLTSDYAELTWEFEIIATQADAFWVTFTLGAANPLRRRFPLYRYIASHCGWRFKSAECGYVGTYSVCNRTLDDCEDRDNSGRFGGHPGLGAGGIKLI